LKLKLKPSQIYVLISLAIMVPIGLLGRSDPIVAPQLDLSAELVVPQFGSILLEVADTPVKQTSGLMGRTKLAKDRGMLFKFGRRQVQTVWMKDTLIPLDVVLLDRDKVVDIKPNLQPCTSWDCPTFESKASADAALEINAGLVDKLGIKVGDRLNILDLKVKLKR
jgi:uncharacterized protein